MDRHLCTVSCYYRFRILFQHGTLCNGRFVRIVLQEKFVTPEKCGQYRAAQVKNIQSGNRKEQATERPRQSEHLPISGFQGLGLYRSGESF